MDLPRSINLRYSGSHCASIFRLGLSRPELGVFVLFPVVPDNAFFALGTMLHVPRGTLEGSPCSRAELLA